MNTYRTGDGLRLAYQVDGDRTAPVLVFVNSLATDRHMWDAQVAALSMRFHVVRYDCRGHGQSDVPNEPSTIEQLGRDVLALLDHLDVAHAHICGLSLGGLTTLWFAAHYPERVTRAVFANTAARVGTAESWSARIAAVRTGGMVAVRDAVVARFLSVPFRAAHPDVARALGDVIERTSPAGYIAACAALRDADLRPIVGTIRVPALIIAGALDEATPPRQSEELHTAIAGSELVVLPNAAHLGNVEQPAAFNAHLLHFLTAA